MHSLCDAGDYIVADGNAHYTTVLAAERAGLEISYVENSGEPEYTINPEGYRDAIRDVADQGYRVSMAVLTYPDGNYGNLVDARRVADICHDEGVPLLLNGAYSIGRMPVSARELDADIVVGSGHKSMASSGPIGILGAKQEYADIIFRRSKSKKNKEVELLGCTVRGAGLLTMMASFPHVVERLGIWQKEVEKARWFSSQLEELGIEQQGEKPHNHDLMFFKSERLYEISKTARKGRYFLYHELKDRGICGIKPGLTRQFKLSTYLIPKEDLDRVVSAFQEIIEGGPGCRQNRASTGSSSCRPLPYLSELDERLQHLSRYEYAPAGSVHGNPCVEGGAYDKHGSLISDFASYLRDDLALVVDPQIMRALDRLQVHQRPFRDPGPGFRHNSVERPHRP